MVQDMPTVDGDNPSVEPEIGLLATHFGGKPPLVERFRRGQLRAQMFGDAGETLTIGRYEITGKIGAGAMGAVYRAVDPALDRQVAVKVLHRSDEMHRARMTIEAKALAKLAHPNVVTVHEVGTEDDQLFVAMELVQGRTLGAWLEAPEGPRVLDVFVQAAEGLQAAHDAGIVHRDFKPDNVIVGDDGRVRVLDFGMARTPGAPLLQEVEGEVTEQPALEPAITRTGLLAGTPGYMAPEQFEGARVDGRADQFAFCIALHEAIWGARPFSGETVAELARAVLGGQTRLFEGEPRAGLEPHEIEAANAVIERGLKTDPAERFDSMQEVASSLRTVPAIVETTSAPRARQLFGGLAATLSIMLVGLFYVTAPREPETGVEATAVVNQAAEGVEAVLSNRCGETVRYAIGSKDTPVEDLTVQSLDAGHSLPVTLNEERLVWIIKDDGTRGAGGGTKDPNEEVTIGPRCSAINVGPIGSYRARSVEDATASQKRCGLGTELRNGACLQIEWDPSLAICSGDDCHISRVVLFGDGTTPALLLRQARFVPAQNDRGTPLGFKVFGVHKDTVMGRLGFESGDIIRTVNDIKLEGDLSEVAPALQEFARTAEVITVVFERDGQVRERELRIRD